MTYGTLISTVSVAAGGAASITFGSGGTIPQTYQDILIVISARNNSAGNSDIYAQFNGDTAGNYGFKRVYGTGSATSADSGSSSSTGFRIGRSLDSGYTANTFSSSLFYLPNYTSSNAKTGSSEQVEENNATGSLQLLTHCSWSGTSAITSIVLKQLDGNNFAQYTTASLYGIK